MSRPRKSISLKTKLAAALREMLRPDASGHLVPIIDRNDAKLMSDDQVVSLFHFDHVVPHAIGGSDHHSNLTPRPILEHREKTAKRDVPTIAKGKRLEKSHDEFRQRLLAKGNPGVAEGEGVPVRAEMPARPGAKLKSRGFAGSKKFDGTVKWKNRS